jgi:tRNA A22 N-methylase
VTRTQRNSIRPYFFAEKHMHSSCILSVLMHVLAVSRNFFPCISFSWAVSRSVFLERTSFSRPRLRISFFASNTPFEYENDVAAAKNAFSILARKSISWKRLGPVIDLAVGDRSSNQRLRSVCDVGTDHGLLATALAMTTRFNCVLGVDISDRAMQDGALKLYDEIMSFRRVNSSDTRVWKELNLDFRPSDGLQNVNPGEADIVCIAGMGVYTMVGILTARQVNTPSPQLLLDHLNTQQLLLQPTNSRPRNMMFLYNRLRDIGWTMQNERLEYISSRWYLTSLFERSQSSLLRVPGAHVATTTDNDVLRELTRWVAHHRKWILDDAFKAGEALRKDDEKWLAEFNN